MAGLRLHARCWWSNLGHEQGSSDAGAHRKARAPQTRVRQWAAVLEQGSAAGDARLGTWARALLKAMDKKKGGME